MIAASSQNRFYWSLLKVYTTVVWTNWPICTVQFEGSSRTARPEGESEGERINLTTVVFRSVTQAISVAEEHLPPATRRYRMTRWQRVWGLKPLDVAFLRIHLNATYREIVGLASHKCRVRDLLQSEWAAFPAPRNWMQQDTTNGLRLGK
jgi:hypothetical protein